MFLVTKRYDVFCNLNTGLDDVEYLVATFYKEEAAADYVQFLNENMDSIFVVYHYEEESME